jgi:acid phosphatase
MFPVKLPQLYLFVVVVIACQMTVAQTTIPSPSHVVVVMEENHSYSEIMGSSQAPYINTLASVGAVFTHSYGVSHPSEPNYLALFSGSTHGVTTDNCPLTFSSGSLESQLLAASKTFKGYSEELPSVGSMVCSYHEYARKHVPWTDFSTGKSTDNLPFSYFPSSNFASLPTVSFVIPDLMDDMHDGSIQQGDAWLQQHLMNYVTWARNNNSLLIVTFDEDDFTTSNHILTLFVGSMVKPGKYTQTINHYNVLRTIEQMYKLPYLGKAATATPITNVWK